MDDFLDIVNFFVGELEYIFGFTSKIESRKTLEHGSAMGLLLEFSGHVS